MRQAADLRLATKTYCETWSESAVKAEAANRQAGKLNCTMKVEKHRAAIEVKGKFPKEGEQREGGEMKDDDDEKSLLIYRKFHLMLSKKRKLAAQMKYY